MEKVSLNRTIELIRKDLIAYEEPFVKAVLFIAGFKYTFHHRLMIYFMTHWYLKPFYVIWRLYIFHLSWKFGIETSCTQSLPEYFTIAHFGGIVFIPESCGHHVYIRQGCTVGRSGRFGGRTPRIGNYVEMGANACVIGDITIGNNVKIAAGAIVNKDVPDNCLVGGVPARIIKSIPLNL